MLELKGAILYVHLEEACLSLLREGFKKIIEFSIKDLNQPPTPHNRKKRQVEGLIVMGVSGSR